MLIDDQEDIFFIIQSVVKKRNISLCMLFSRHVLFFRNMFFFLFHYFIYVAGTETI